MFNFKNHTSFFCDTSRLVTLYHIFFWWSDKLTSLSQHEVDPLPFGFLSLPFSIFAMLKRSRACAWCCLQSHLKAFNILSSRKNMMHWQKSLQFSFNCSEKNWYITSFHICDSTISWIYPPPRIPVANEGWSVGIPDPKNGSKNPGGSDACDFVVSPPPIYWGKLQQFVKVRRVISAPTIFLGPDFFYAPAGLSDSSPT